jgi:glycerol kinase
VLRTPEELDAVAGAVPDSGGVVFVPALAGLGAPHWAPNAHGVLTGLQLSTQRGHIARAVAEGIAASVALLAQAAAADLGAPLTALRVDGGLTRSRLLLQAQADLLGVPVLACRTPHATALGAAALARLALGEPGPVTTAEVQATVEPSVSDDQSSERKGAYLSALTAALTYRGCGGASPRASRA